MANQAKISDSTFLDSSESDFSESASGHISHLNGQQGHFIYEGTKKGRKRDFRFMPDFYTIPQIRKFKDKWYVEYYFKNPFHLLEEGAKEFDRFKVYEGINRYHGEDKEEFAEKLRNAVEMALKNGYNPFNEKKKRIIHLEKVLIKKEVEDKEQSKGEKIIVLLDRYLASGVENGITEKSLESYTTPVNHFKKWLAEKGWTERGVKEFTEQDIVSFMTELQLKRKWRGKTFNNVRNYVLMWFGWFKKKKFISESQVSPDSIDLQDDNSTKNEYYHGVVRNKVKEALESDPVLKRACTFVYLATVRSYMELSQILVGDIDMENRVIKIKESVGKTGYRFIPISNELAELLEGMEYHKFPLNYYLFGEKAQISPVRIYKNFLSNRYKKIKTKVGIGDDYTIYSWKHTRVVDLKRAGYTDAEIQDLTGHTDSESYNTYARNFGISLNTRLKGKTVEF